MGATRNTGYLENLIAYDASNNVAIATTAIDNAFKITMGGSVKMTGALSGTSATFSSSAAASTVDIRVPVESPATGKVALSIGTSNGANDILRWFDGATQLGVIKNSGNVGIGTTSPANPLHIQSNTLSQLNVTALSGNTNAQINLEPTGTGIALIGPANPVDLSFRTNATPRMRITSGGNVGIGVTPSAWGASPFYALQMGASGTFLVGRTDAISQTQLGSNAYYDGTNWKYVISSSSYAARYYQNGGEHVFENATNGTAGNNITWNPRMTITSGGTIKSTLDQSANNQFINLVGTQSSYNQEYSLGIATSSKDFRIYDITAGSERMRITSGGNVMIGTTSDQGSRLYVEGGTNSFYVKGNTSTSFGAAITAINSSSTELFLVRNDGLIYTGVASLSPYNYGVSGVALYVASSGAIGYTTSTRESKANITNIDSVNWIHSLQPVTFNKKKKDNEGNYTEELESELQYGLIAEDVESINPNFVFYNNEGKLAGVHYDRLITPLLKAIQEQQAQIEELKSKLN